MKVEQIMTRNVRSCRVEDSLDVAAGAMWEQDCGCVPIIASADDGRQIVVAMLTDRDIAMAAYTQGRPLHEIKCSSAMSRQLCSCHPNDPVSLAIKILAKNQLKRLPVISGDMELVGILSLADVAREAEREGTQQTRETTDGQVAEAVEAISHPREPRGELMPAA